MKPDWKDAPEWANWLVQSALGVWGWFEFEPKVLMLGKKGGVWTTFYKGRSQACFVTTAWKDSKEVRP